MIVLRKHEAFAVFAAQKPASQRHAGKNTQIVPRTRSKNLRFGLAVKPIVYHLNDVSAAVCRLIGLLVLLQKTTD